MNHGSNVVAGRAQEPWDLKHHRSPLVLLLACKCSKVPGEVILISSAQSGEAVIDPHDTVAVGTYSIDELRSRTTVSLISHLSLSPYKDWGLVVIVLPAHCMCCFDVCGLQ